jgi:hypothetical protein
MTTMAIFTTTLKLNDETFIIQERSDDGIIRCTWETLDGTVLAHLTPEGARRLAQASHPEVTVNGA